jgi:hypothetical protein
MAQVIQLSKTLDNDVGYYNKEIIKRKQRDNKDIAQEQVRTSSSSFGLVAIAPQVNPEGLVLPDEEEGSPDPYPVKQGPTSPPDWIQSKQVKRAVVQFYHNQGQGNKQERKLKVRLNCDFGSGEENIDFIATLTNDLGNFKKYHPEESREFIQDWAMTNRSVIRKTYTTKPYMGKFHENNGWRKGLSQINQIEPWTGCLLWYDAQAKAYIGLIRIYQWEEIFELEQDKITDRQRQTNLKAQKLWFNPEHLNIIRPKTWAQKRGLA